MDKILSDIIIEDDNGPFTTVKASFTHGWGLFAVKPFKMGEVVIDYTGFPNSWREARYDQLTDHQIGYGWYVMIDNERCMLADRWNKFSYMNHSRRPNCDLYQDQKTIIAHRDIEIGEELFIDYRLEVRPNRVEFPSWI